MAHKKSKPKMEYWRTSWVGSDELDLYKQGNKIIGIKNGKKVREWKNYDLFRMEELFRYDEIG